MFSFTVISKFFELFLFWKYGVELFFTSFIRFFHKSTLNPEVVG